jgi:hypothetical protein
MLHSSSDFQSLLLMEVLLTLLNKLWVATWYLNFSMKVKQREGFMKKKWEGAFKHWDLRLLDILAHTHYDWMMLNMLDIVDWY